MRHGLDELLAQRIHGLACGYEDANDTARLADDPIAKLLLGRDAVTFAVPNRNRAVLRSIADGGFNWTSKLTHAFGEYGIPLEVHPDKPDTTTAEVPVAVVAASEQAIALERGGPDDPNAKGERMLVAINAGARAAELALPPGVFEGIRLESLTVAGLVGIAVRSDAQGRRTLVMPARSAGLFLAVPRTAV